MRQLFEAAVSWSYDSPAKGGLHHAHYPGRVANRMDLLKWTSRAAALIFAIMLHGSNSARAAASQSQIGQGCRASLLTIQNKLHRLIVNRISTAKYRLNVL